MERIRILISDVPGVLRDIIKDTLAAQTDMAVVGEPSGRAALLEAVDRTAPDFLIRGEGLDDDVDAVLERRPRLKVLSVESDGRNTVLCELRPRVSALGEVSPQTLLDSIRAAHLAET